MLKPLPTSPKGEEKMEKSTQFPSFRKGEGRFKMKI